MQPFFRTTACGLAVACFTHGAVADTAGTVLFAQPGTQIVGESGAVRAAVKGDVLQTGERLVTPPGAISQLVLPDGSLIGMRPESELRITPAPAGSESRAPVVGLISGAARLIGAELMDNKRISNFTLQSGAATVSAKGADLESAVVRPEGKPVSGSGIAAAPGSYQRLLVGVANVANGNQVAALAPQQVSFVGGANAAPVALATPAHNLFAGNRSGAGPQGGPGTVAGAAQSTRIAPPSLVKPFTPPPPLLPTAPPAAAIKLPVPVPVVRPCTRFIGKTCAQ